MSGLIEEYKKENNIVENNNSNNNQKTLNMPIRITGYEDQFFVGTRLDTKELVKVKLRDVPDNPNSKFTRPTIKEFSTKNEKRFCKINESIISFDNTYKEEDGTYNSRWANTLSNQKRKSDVFIVNANVSITDNGSFKGVSIKILKKCEIVNSVESLEKSLMNCFVPKTFKARNFAVIRLTDNSGSCETVIVYPKLIETIVDEDKVNVMDTPEESLKNFYEKNNKASMVKDLVVNPNISTEIIHGATLYTGGDTTTKIVDDNRNVSFLNENYFVDSDKKVLGYKKTVIALRSRSDGSLFAVYVKPYINNSKPLPIENAKV